MAGNQRLGGVIWQGLFITKSRPFREVAKLMDSWTLSVFVSSCFGRQERKHDRRDYASNQVKAPSGYWHEIISCLLFVAAPSSNTLTGRYLVWGSQAGWFDRLYRTFLGVVIRFRVSSEHRAAKWLAAAMLRTFLFSFSFSSFFSMSVIPHPSVQSVRRSLFFFFFCHRRWADLMLQELPSWLASRRARSWKRGVLGQWRRRYDATCIVAISKAV